MEDKIQKEFGDPEEEARKRKREALAKKRMERSKKVVFTPFPPDDRENPNVQRPFDTF